MALALRTLCDSISDLNVDGVKIHDIDEIPSSDLRRPMLFPEPVDFITDLTVTRDSTGASVAKMTAEYNITYTFCHSPVGAGRSGLDAYPDMLEKVMAILDAILAIETIIGAVDLTANAIPTFGPVPDPAGNMYIGCKLVFRVMEFVN